MKYDTKLLLLYAYQHFNVAVLQFDVRTILLTLTLFLFKNVDAGKTPDKIYDVEICYHRLGKKMTYTDQTDMLQLKSSYKPYMAMAKQRNIKVGCFMAYGEPALDDGTVKADYEAGNLWLDVYSLAPNIRSKIINKEQISLVEWNEAYNTYLLPDFLGFTGKKPVALSYSYGTDNFKDYITQLLGARNSFYNGNTDYGVGYGNPNDQPYSFSRFKSKIGTTRWYDYAKTHGNDFSGALALVSAEIDACKQAGGWYNNFTHWHNYYSDGNEQWAEAYLDLLASKNVNDEIYFAGYGEAVAYLVYREIITKAVMCSPEDNLNNQLDIVIDTENKLNIDTDLLQVPISIKFSTIGTPLEGCIICSDYNLINLGGDYYIVEIPYGVKCASVFKDVNVTVAAKNYTRTYGDANPTFEFTTVGGPLFGKPEITCEAIETSPVGTYDIVVKQGTVKNYNVTYVGGTLTVTKAPLTIKAGNYTMKQGDTLPEFIVSYEGWKNGETAAVLTKQPTLTTTATSESEPGTYEVVVSGAEAQNYDISYTKGTLTVTEADPVTITANSYSREYGEANPVLEYTSEGAAVDGEPAITCEATETSPVGTYDIVVKQGTVKNYNVNYVSGTLTVTKAPLTVSVGNCTREYGHDNPEFTLTYGGG